MTNVPKPEDYILLGIEPDTTAEDAEKAYQRMKGLYSEGSLATYSLMNEDERREILTRIERAYLRISKVLSRRPPDPDSDDAHIFDLTVSQDTTGIPERHIGPFLRRCREDLGMTLKEVAKRTRIRTTHLESIEEERYSQLPAPVYLRGFLMEFARALEIEDAEELATRYIALMQGDVPEP
ncbi:MAG: helix-turn-helix domain-containing protein [bacterium]|nr:MAG: helix-turn-helix domain-containing protein [bacterium]